MGRGVEPFGMKGDESGSLQRLQASCWLSVGDRMYHFRSLPEISDSKSANYNSQTVFGRSSPIRSYSDSSARTINVSFDLYSTDEKTREENFKFVRSIAMAVHPKYGGTYDPPPICKFTCGNLLSGKDVDDSDPSPLQCLIMNYNFNYGRDSIFDNHMLPFHISGSLDLEVIHTPQTLPGQKEVLEGKF